MDFGADESTANRRKVKVSLRKGTHSCQECRRRKVKCIYATDRPDNLNASCIVCERRGAQCISQSDSPALGDADAVDRIGSASARARARARARVRAKADLNVDDRFLAEDPDAFVIDADLTHVRDDDPSAPAPLPSVQIAEDLTLQEPSAHVTIREALLRALPCETDISILLERVGIVSALCYQSDYKSYSSGSDTMPKQQVLARSLLYPERHPTLLARQMLLFAAAVQDLSPKEVVPALTEHQHVIMKRLAESAIKLVNMDDALLGTLESLENLMFETFYHMDCGNIRRAWITTRRAVTAAQMLGLHRPGHHRFTLINDESDLEPEVMWSTIVGLERMLSLLLGLPTSTGHMILAFQTITSDSALGHNLSALVGSLTAKILERNHVESAQQALDMTGEIDREIILAAEQMPSVFWRPLAFAGLERDSWKALIETRRAFGHMCYYSLVVQLHLPHMLCPHNASQRVYSKIACVNASREVLTRETELRMFNPVSACCRMSDFLALIAGMALMLGHITSHCGNEWDRLLAHQRLGDRAIVERTLDCIDPMFDLHGDVLAVRCAALLRDLLIIEEDAARQHNLRAGQSHEMKHGQRSQRDILIMRVPYLGSIRISREGVAALPAARIEQVQSLSEGVTIGGIGSVLIGRPLSSYPSENHDATNIAVLPAAPTSATYDPGQHHLATHNAPVISARSPSGSDLMFPDAAASFDDWVFQGVDTAFMETLMRGSAVPPSDDLDDGRWDISTFP
ncbi:hypothetical protein LTR66_002460 [Elasticomyces elasticus]|nr:hypothetical protein LTR66_002460 [Elasticomyces elasticus]KAK5011717.1 hypothetical protein LTR28_007256 [Elasticomyces elasticus]